MSYQSSSNCPQISNINYYKRIYQFWSIYLNIRMNCITCRPTRKDPSIRTIRWFYTTKFTNCFATKTIRIPFQRHFFTSKVTSADRNSFYVFVLFLTVFYACGIPVSYWTQVKYQCITFILYCNDLQNIIKQQWNTVSDAKLGWIWKSNRYHLCRYCSSAFNFLHDIFTQLLSNKNIYYPRRFVEIYYENDIMLVQPRQDPISQCSKRLLVFPVVCWWLWKEPVCWWCNAASSARFLECWTRNSSGDEIANVNFLYDDIVHALKMQWTLA